LRRSSVERWTEADLVPNYKRALIPGGTYFFTVVTHARAEFLCDGPARRLLRIAIRDCQAQRPFTVQAFVLLPDHLHCIWSMPDGDADYSTRWGVIKKAFTEAWLEAGGGELGISVARKGDRRRGVWQPRFWEHWIRDRKDFERHLNYIHYNPVKHGLVCCPHAWPYSTFMRWVKAGVYEPSWQCACEGRQAEPITFEDLPETAME